METAVASTCGYGHQMGAGAYVCPQCGAPALMAYLPRSQQQIAAAVAVRTPARTAEGPAFGHVLALIGLVAGAVSMLGLPLFGPRLLVLAVLGFVCSLSALRRDATLAPTAVAVSAAALCAPVLLALLR
jgi:hypothetical protein